jgi:hypothetical protein
LEQLKTGAPVAGVVIELKSDQGARYTASDANGWFVFDGLAAGEYQIAPYAHGFPDSVRQLASPQRIRMRARGCVNQIVLIPRVGP